MLHCFCFSFSFSVFIHIHFEISGDEFPTRFDFQKVRAIFLNALLFTVSPISHTCQLTLFLPKVLLINKTYHIESTIQEVKFY